MRELAARIWLRVREPPGKSWRGRFWGFLRHSVLIASVLVVIADFGWLDWLERTMIHVSWRVPEEQTNKERDISGPLVLVIDDKTYEERFRERSPLDRAELNRILEHIKDACDKDVCPKALVIDIDLSPIVQPNENEQQAQRKLDETLDAIADQIPLVLMTPFAVETNELRKRKLEWMRARCERGNVKFGHGIVHSNAGVVLRYLPHEDLLGAGDACSRPGVCQEVREIDKNKDGTLRYLDRLTAEQSILGLRAKVREKPLNLSFLKDKRRISIAAKDGYTKPDWVQEISGRVIFLGGAYGHADFFLTPFGKQPGVMIHAASYYSRNKPVFELPHWTLFLIEIGLGVGFLYLFQPLWGCYYGVRGGRSNEPFVRYAGRRLGSWLLLAVIVSIPVVMSYAAIAWAAEALAQAMWANPGPMILAMLLKAKSAQEETELERARKKEPARATQETVDEPTARPYEGWRRIGLWLFEYAGLVVFGGWAVLILVKGH